MDIAPEARPVLPEGPPWAYAIFAPAFYVPQGLGGGHPEAAPSTADSQGFLEQTGRGRYQKRT
jgi:hypothetical protein